MIGVRDRTMDLESGGAGRGESENLKKEREESSTAVLLGFGDLLRIASVGSLAQQQLG